LGAMAWAQQGHTIEQAEVALARILPRLAALDAAVAQTGQASPGLASATLRVPALYFTTSRLEDAMPFVDRGTQLAREIGDDALLAWAYLTRGYIGFLTGSEGSLTDYLAAVASAVRADADFLALALNFVTATYLMEGKLALAKQYAERGLAVAERH